MLEHRRELGSGEGRIVEAQKHLDGKASDGPEAGGVEAYLEGGRAAQNQYAFLYSTDQVTKGRSSKNRIFV